MKSVRLYQFNEYGRLVDTHETVSAAADKTGLGFRKISHSIQARVLCCGQFYFSYWKNFNLFISNNQKLKQSLKLVEAVLSSYDFVHSAIDIDEYAILVDYFKNNKTIHEVAKEHRLDVDKANYLIQSSIDRVSNNLKTLIGRLDTSFLDKDINEVFKNPRVRNFCFENSIYKVSDFEGWDYRSLKRSRHLGETSIKKIETSLAVGGYRLHNNRLVPINTFDELQLHIPKLLA